MTITYSRFPVRFAFQAFRLEVYFQMCMKMFVGSQAAQNPTVIKPAATALNALQHAKYCLPSFYHVGLLVYKRLKGFLG